MEKKPEIWNELNSISPAVANLNVTNVFNVPDQYFDQLSDRVMMRIKAIEAGSTSEELKILSPFLSSLDKKMPFEVEALYFDMFPGELLERIKAIQEASVAEELAEISPLLSSIGKKTPFTVPEGYFDNINPGSIAGNGENGSAKVISINRVNRRKWMTYAAAAVVTGFIGIAAWFFINQKQTTIINIPTVNIGEEIKNIPDNEMQKYLDAFSDAGLDEMPVAEISEPDSDILLGSVEDLSDNELQQYLLDNPEIKDKSKAN